jgi:hypothetical protein
MFQRRVINPMYVARRILARDVSHWTPHYVFNRVMMEVDYLCHPDCPWLTRDAVLLLEQLLCAQDSGFEWGSGRSTLWFARRTQHIVSVEDSPEWYKRIFDRIQQAGLSNVKLVLHETAHLNEEDAEHADYVQAICSFPDESFDYILVDSWARDWCALAAVWKVKTGGILILNNANWYIPPPRANLPRPVLQQPANKRWEAFHQQIADWRKIWTTNGVMHTLLMVKT